MMRNITVLQDTRSKLLAELEQINREAGDNSLTRAQQGRWDRVQAEIKEIDGYIAETEAEMARQAKIAESRATWGFEVGGPSGSDPWDDMNVRRESRDGLRNRAHRVIDQADTLSDKARESLTEAVNGHGGDIAAAFVTARSNPHYRSGFLKVLLNPERGLLTLDPAEMHAFQQVEQVRASMSTSTASAGYLLPLSLDPNVVVANNGAANPARQLATVRQTASSPHRAVTSPGITAEWLAENAVFADASPTFEAVDIPLFKLAAFVVASFEILQDSAADIATILPELLGDARDRLESAAFATGNGTTAPKGVVTALAADSQFVTCTTRGSFTSASAGDVMALLNALPPRARQSKSTAWVANNEILSIIKTQTLGTAGSMLTDMTDDGRLMGFGVYESSSMTSATTSGSYIAVMADFSRFVIVDHVSGPALEYVPVLFDQATGRPNGTRGWVFHHRVGSDYLAPDQGKILKA